ncbi:DnaJ [Acrasis kona]|uniref:DnaJ n=1 Tax=Acrasis kona TaxID=1008807 RepID=A0AAW2Z6G3_9EUKA
MSTKDKLDQDVDYYAVLGIPSSSTEAEIKKAYRKKALEYHPDRNIDNADAVNMFVKINKANRVLTDPQLKLEFDAIIKAKLFQQQRLDGMNQKRRLLRESLEEAERNSKRPKTEQEATHKSPADIRRDAEKIKEQGGYDALHKLVQEKKLMSSKSRHIDVIAKWTKEFDVNEKSLESMFKKFGQVTSFIKIEKKRKAIVTFALGLNAQSACEHLSKENCLEVKIAPGQEIPSQTLHETSATLGADYESLTMLKFKQMAEERKLRKESA